MFDYSVLPEHMRGGARRYIEQGIRPGGFLTAVLANDLLGALSRADGTNIHCLPDYGQFLLTIPMSAKGSYEAVAAWCSQGGIQGFQNDSDK